MIKKPEGKGFVARALSVIALAVCIFVVFDRATVVANAQLVPATIMDCDSKWVKVSDTRSNTSRPTRYREQVQYYPKAVSASGDEAHGWLMMPTRALCAQMVGKEVSIFVHHQNPDENRIHSFLQFWAIPLLIFSFAACIPLSIYSTTGVRVFSAFFALSFTGLAMSELGILGRDSLQQSSTGIAGAPQTTVSHSHKALERCIFTAMYKEKVEHRSQLKTLLCMDEAISDLSSIADLKGLNELYLQNNALTSLEGLSPFTQLRKISVAGNKALTSTRGIESLVLLEEFQANKASLSDLSGLDKLTQLRIVGLMQNNISDVSVFARLSKLESVTVSYNRISDISAFSNKPVLTEFTAYNNDISDASPLYGNSAMNIVGLSGRKYIPCEQIDLLRAMLKPGAKVFGPKQCE